MGGQKRVRSLWHHYFERTKGLIYVVDSSDIKRLDEAREELFAVVENEEMVRVPVLIFANKQDIEGSASTSLVAEKLCLSKIKDRPCAVQGSCAISGDGVHEGLNQLSEMIKEQRKKVLSY